MAEPLLKPDDVLARLQLEAVDRGSTLAEGISVGSRPLTSGDGMFLCPGYSQPIDRALHMARLHAAWSTCDQCEFRFHIDGLSATTLQQTERIQESRSVGVQRTEFGIRGQHINELSRPRIASLTAAFCDSLIRQSTDRRLRFDGAIAPHEDSAGHEIDVRRDDAGMLITGYDGRSSAPDAYVGAVTAIREFGLDVKDIGRCTAASLLEAIRTYTGVLGGILITGAGSPSSYTGIDAFDSLGEPVAVVWRDYGIVLQSARQTNSADANADNRSQSWKLLFPDATQSPSGRRRMARSSGSHTADDFELRYRTWLSRWFPQQSPVSVVIRTDDQLVSQRIQWLIHTLQLNAVCRPGTERPAAGEAMCAMSVAEDDRSFDLFDQTGRQIATTALATLINRAISSQSSHVTAHADEVTGRFWLTDAGRPSRGGQTEHITDALATLGLILKLFTSRRLTLA